jgi:hypothetical protein
VLKNKVILEENLWGAERWKFVRFHSISLRGMGDPLTLRNY